MLFNLTVQGAGALPVHIINLWWPVRAGEGENGRLRCHIATNTAAAEHFKPSSRPSLNSQQLNLGDGKRAQSGEKSVPDDFLLFLLVLLCTDTPLPPSQLSSKCAYVLPLPPAACPPPTSAAFLFPRPTYPRNQKIIQSLKLSQEPVSLRLPPSNLPILPSSTSLHPSTPVPPQCIPAWQTTWDFTSPLKSAASGNHSSSCNILVF